MPVRSLSSSVLAWPRTAEVLAAAATWARRQASERAEVERIGLFGSYARGDAGVGSDLDLVAIVREAAEPFEARGRTWPTEELPVPAELLIYTAAEWRQLIESSTRMARTLREELRRLAP